MSANCLAQVWGWLPPPDDISSAVLSPHVIGRTRLGVVTAHSCSMNHPNLLYQCLRGSSATSTNRSETRSAKRPTSVASDADARPFRSRDNRSLAQNIELLSVLEERKLEADKEEGRTNIRALVRTVILERQPALQHEPKDLLKEVKRCSMLLKRGSNAGTSALGKRIKARSDIGRTKRVR